MLAGCTRRAMSYSAAVAKNAPSQPSQPSTQRTSSPIRNQNTFNSTANIQQTQPSSLKRSPSPSHIPRTIGTEQSSYVLTLVTDQKHHQRMTNLRSKYFPKRINKLEAHLTLFHALPFSKLDSDVVPLIKEVASRTQRFNIHATRPFKMKRGIAVSVSKENGSRQAQSVHLALQRPWLEAGFLSDQDAGGCRIHYTIMNKVDDESEVQRAFEEVNGSWKDDWCVATGLGLWKYEQGGRWIYTEGFDFQGGAESQ